MVENKCAVCGKPILGHWLEVGKNKSVCLTCSSVTVYDLYIKGIISAYPKTIEVDDVTIIDDKPANEDVENYVASKQALSSPYGMKADVIITDDAPVYQDTDSITASEQENNSTETEYGTPFEVSESN